MAREIVTHSWCDLCLVDDDAREPGTELVAQVGQGTKQLVVDLCEKHRKELVDPLVTLLAEHGRPASAPALLPASLSTYRQKNSKSMRGPFVCQVPGCAATRPFASASSLSWHVRNGHDMQFTEYRQKHGLVRAELPPDELAAFNARVAMRKSPVRVPPVETLDEQGDEQGVEQGDEPLSFTEKKRVAVGMPVGGELPSSAYTCHVEGCDVSYPPESYRRPTQALGVHLARAHGIRSAKAHPNGPLRDDDPAHEQLVE